MHEYYYTPTKVKENIYLMKDTFSGLKVDKHRMFFKLMLPFPEVFNSAQNMLHAAALALKIGKNSCNGTLFLAVLI